MKTFPEINGMSKKDLTAAITMGQNCFDSIKPEFQQDLKDRLAHMRDRLRRLNAVEIANKLCTRVERGIKAYSAKRRESF